MLFPLEKTHVKPGIMLIETMLSGDPLYCIWDFLVFCWFALFHKTMYLIKDFEPCWFKSCSFRQTVVTFCQMQSGHSQSYYKFLRFTGMYFFDKFTVFCRLLGILRNLAGKSGNLSLIWKIELWIWIFFACYVCLICKTM